MHKSLSLSASLSLAVLLGCAACAPAAPRQDSRFGASVRGLVAQQALPPRPSGDPGMDAAAARGALSRYRQSYQGPAPASPQRAFFNAVGAGNGN